MKTLTLAVLLLALVPTTARAWEAPDQRPASPIVTGLASDARAFWAERGMTTECPNGVTVWQAPDLFGAWGRGDGATCELWISDDAAGKLQFGPELTRFDLIDVCTTVTHEVGHAVGLAHTETGVMAGGDSKPSVPREWAPYFCRVWAGEVMNVQHRLDGVSPRTLRRWQRHRPR